MNNDDNTDAPLPDDEPTPEELRAAGTMRPLEALPSNWTIKGNPRLIEELSEATLKIPQVSRKDRHFGLNRDA